MPQGKMKVKAKGAPPAKKDKSKKTHGGIQKGGNNLKKGKFTIAPKKQVKLVKFLWIPPTMSAVLTASLLSPPNSTILVFWPSGTHALWYDLGVLKTGGQCLGGPWGCFCYPRSKRSNQAGVPDLQAIQL